MEIVNISIHENMTTVFWKRNSNILRITVENLKQMTFAEEHEKLLILKSGNFSNENFPDTLQAYSYDAISIFEVAPPKTYRFYYFSDPKSGNLSQICLAY